MATPIIKQVPPEYVGGKILFCGTDGRFYNAAGQAVKHSFSPSSQTNRPNMHSSYPMMRQYAHRLCHHLVYETFVGPRTKGMEIDHINGNKLDWSLNNLREITPAENRRCAQYLRVLREKIPHHWQTFEREDYLRFYSMPLDEFKAMLAIYTNTPHPVDWDMTHHCEC